ncbi:ISAs1 family transposase [[Leptolyngbya] sp. PCC 7376]|uniref:ISAs1 family transposase n=1 Tax=[Leptolyngbya] sp. PCC 7376 TaxID=111781 RepID=UPI0002E87D26|nr:ISAs1 family transposase [[Leptolyngbya] sp. PCC 7376]
MHYPDNNSQDFVTAISLFCQQRKIALGIKMSRNKQESEISVIQQLLEELDLPPVTVTLDALHTQKNSSATRHHQHDYVITVKGNQKKLYQVLIDYCLEHEPLAKTESKDIDHGRQEKRWVEVWSLPTFFTTQWCDVQSVVRVTRWGCRQNKDYDNQMFYITSLSPQGQKLSRVIRQHWQIENNLHWVKDVIFQEDQAQQTRGNAPQNFAIFRSWVISLLRLHGYHSMTEAMAMISHKLPLLLSFCTS